MDINNFIKIGASVNIKRTDGKYELFAFLFCLFGCVFCSLCVQFKAKKKNILIEVNFLREAMESVDAAALFETADFLITKNTHRDFDYKTKLNKNEFPLVV